MTQRTPEEDFLLLNPGPVPLTDDAREAMDAPMVSHRSAEFEATYERAQRGLDYVFTESTLDGRHTAEEETGTSDGRPSVRPSPHERRRSGVPVPG